MMKFAFRAECRADLDALVTICEFTQHQLEVDFSDLARGMHLMPDVAGIVDFDGDYETLLHLMTTVPNSHVMQETLTDDPKIISAIKEDWLVAFSLVRKPLHPYRFRDVDA